MEQAKGARPPKAEVGVKWRFLHEESAGISLSAYPQIGFDFSSSSDRRGLTEGGTEFLFPFQTAKTLGPVLVFAEVGRLWREHLPGEWIAGLAAAYELTETLSLLGEFHGVADEDFDDGSVFLNDGLKWKFHERLSVLAAGGPSLPRLWQRIANICLCKAAITLPSSIFHLLRRRRFLLSSATPRRRH